MAISYKIHFICNIKNKVLTSEWSNIEPLDPPSCLLGKLRPGTVRWSKIRCSLMLGIGKAWKVMFRVHMMLKKLGSIIHYFVTGTLWNSPVQVRTPCSFERPFFNLAHCLIDRLQMRQVKHNIFWCAFATYSMVCLGTLASLLSIPLGKSLIVHDPLWVHNRG